MAESPVTSVLEKLQLVVTEEVKFLGSVAEDIDWIKRELETIQVFLRDADRKKDSDEGLKIWVKQVRDLAFDIEDVLDEYTLSTTTSKNNQQGFVVAGFFHRIKHMVTSMLAKHQIAGRVHALKTRASEILERRQRHDLSSIELDRDHIHSHGDQEEDYLIANSVVDPQEVLGFGKDIEALTRLLTCGGVFGKLTVVSIVGMGGSGKTTLVNKLYNSLEIKANFDCCAWVSVSQSYKLREILYTILKNITSDGSGRTIDLSSVDVAAMDIKELIRALFCSLQKRRYLIVLDDVWSDKVWEMIKNALPDQSNGSRVVITTRQKHIVEEIDISNIIHHLRPLQHDEAWALFCHNAFRNNNNNNDNETLNYEIGEIAENMLRKCQGLPIAIVAIGRLLARKKRTVLEWARVGNSLYSELKNNSKFSSFRSVLSLSYNDLPWYLKSCFMYCNIFPEDYNIPKSRLINLWVAEGFIQVKRNLAPEDVAEAYVDELLDRNLLQIADYGLHGQVTNVKVHDLLRELALSRLEEESFATSSVGQIPEKYSKARRFSIEGCSSSETITPPTPLVSLKKLRSFFMFNMESMPAFVYKVLSSFRLLKVLYLEDAPIDKLPERVCDLLFLRYLNLKGTRLKKLPKSIRKLINLQTLDIRDTEIRKLPKEITKLKKLRHLLMKWYRGAYPYKFSNCNCGAEIEGGKIGRMNNLLTLSGINSTKDIVREVGDLINLRKFEILDVDKDHGHVLCRSIEKMTGLQDLTISSSSEFTPLCLKSMASPPRYLRTLELKGCMETLPLWLSQLHNVVKIRLQFSRLSEDVLGFFQCLKGLTSLQFYEAFTGKEMRCNAGGYGKLINLGLNRLDYTELIVIEKSGMPCLQTMWIRSCKKMKSVPEGIENLTTLQCLQLVDMPEEFVDKLRKTGSENWKVKHVGKVIRRYMKDNKWYSENL